MAEVRAAGFIIFRRLPQIEYLLLQTSYGINHWTPPKGHVEVGESDLETAYRETEEEAGLTRAQIKLSDSFKKSLFYKANGKRKEVVYWLAEVLDPKVTIILSQEHQLHRWLPLKEAQEVSEFPDMKNLLGECEEFLHQ